MYQRPKPRTKYVGVYAIRHVGTGRTYVGGSTDMTGRWMHHRFMLRNSQHKTKALQEAWLCDGEGSFEFVVLEKCAKADLLACEQAWLTKTKNPYNTSPTVITGYSRTGPSPANRAAALKRWERPEHRAKIAATWAGKKFLPVDTK